MMMMPLPGTMSTVAVVITTGRIGVRPLPHDLGPACVPHGKGPLRLHSPDPKSIDAAGLFFVYLV